MGKVLQLSEKRYRHSLRELSEQVMEMTAIAQQQGQLAEEARQVSLRCQSLCSWLVGMEPMPRAA